MQFVCIIQKCSDNSVTVVEGPFPDSHAAGEYAEQRNLQIGPRYRATVQVITRPLGL